MGIQFASVRSDTVIGTRILHFDKRSKSIKITLFLPYSNDGDYICRYSISWPDRTESGVSRGADLIHAMLLAVKKTNAIIFSSPEAQSGDLEWSPSNNASCLFGKAVPRRLRLAGPENLNRIRLASTAIPD